MSPQSHRPSTPSGPSGLPFDDVRDLLNHFPEPDKATAHVARQRLAAPGHLNGTALAETAAWLAGLRATTTPTLVRTGLALFVANLSGAPYTPGGILDVMEAVSSGCHMASQLCLRQGVGLKVYDLALDVPTPDPRQDAVMTEQECAATMAFGMEATAGLDMVILAQAGQGGQAAAYALLTLLAPELGAGLNVGLPTAWGDFIAAVLRAHGGVAADPFEVLRRAGSRDLAALTGAVMAARSQCQPVVLEGAGGLAVAAVLAKAGPDNLVHCLYADADPGHRAVASGLGVPHTVAVAADGEGMGGLLALPQLQAALDALTLADILDKARDG